jgi:hypothetical protein
MVVSLYSSCGLKAYCIDMFGSFLFLFYACTLLLWFIVSHIIKMVFTVLSLLDIGFPYSSFVRLVWWLQIPSVFAYFGRSLSLHFWRIILLSIIILVGIVIFQGFEYVIPFTPGLQGICWKTCHLSNGVALKCDLAHFSCRFKESFFVLYFLTVWL